MTVIGFVGYPNVGKSSVINIFMENKRLQVSATPGKVCNLLYFEQIIDVKNKNTLLQIGIWNLYLHSFLIYTCRP